jgi:hypothetical protein
MTTANHLEQLRAEVAYRRQRLDLYRAKAYGPRATNSARLTELERDYELATSRLKRALAGTPGPPGDPKPLAAPADSASDGTAGQR